MDFLQDIGLWYLPNPKSHALGGLCENGPQMLRWVHNNAESMAQKGDGDKKEVNIKAQCCQPGAYWKRWKEHEELIAQQKAQV